ncbi:hypothetical protein [Bacillus sp. es.034]|uniref:hypothetical protein n=1 Tax=Bacillus sp. es.034 TaxID=1761763 RepID=UPI0015CF36EC|nr:hypothetical protein [Bacillus sp. es.034]
MAWEVVQYRWVEWGQSQFYPTLFPFLPLSKIGIEPDLPVQATPTIQIKPQVIAYLAN